MIGNLIKGDWYIIDVTDSLEKIFVKKLGNFTIEQAEVKFEEYKTENPFIKFELVLVVSN